MTKPENGDQEPEKAEGSQEWDAMRLQAFLARAGVASRRSSESLILEGRVSVNGQVLTKLGSKVFPHDEICLDGKRLQLEEKKRYIVLNKPRGYLSSMADPEGRPLACDILKPSVLERVYNIGRLDQWSSGLLLFTNDGDFASLIGHPSGEIEKEYEVETDQEIPEAFLHEFMRGLRADGIVYKALKARKLGQKKARIVLIEGKNREIRNALAARGLRALSLRRMRIGPLLMGELPEGSFRELTPQEINALQSAARQNRGMEHDSSH